MLLTFTLITLCMLMCTHCGRKDHLAKFCYDRIHDSNLANKFIWVRKGAYLHGPNKVRVPKTTPILFNVGRRESIGALRWMRSELKGDNFGCITFKGSLVEGPP